MNNHTITPTITTRAALHLILALCALLVVRAYRHTVHAFRACWQWLNTCHNFGNEEGDILLTGWQYSGIAALVMFAALALSVIPIL